VSLPTFVALNLKEPVLGLQTRNQKWQLRTEKKERLFDRVFLTLPLPQAVNLLTPEIVPREKIRFWQRFKMIGAACLLLRLKQAFLPGDTYWLNILDRQFPFIVVVEHTNFIESKHYGGEVIVYVGGYYSSDQGIFRWSKERVFNYFSPYLRRINPSFERFLIDYQLFRSRWAQPIIPKNYSPPEIELRPKSLYWLTTHHIYPWDRGVNFGLQLAQQAANLV